MLKVAYLPKEFAEVDTLLNAGYKVISFTGDAQGAMLVLHKSDRPKQTRTRIPLSQEILRGFTIPTEADGEEGLPL